jgi:hypothetical protein
MENVSIFKKNILDIGHLPTACLLLGYFICWIEMYFLHNRTGRTTMLAPLLFMYLSVIILILNRKFITSFYYWFKTKSSKLDKLMKGFIYLSFIMIMVIIGLAFCASLLPPHLSQEFDALNYHLSIPRQHLILNSFRHLLWSSADLFMLPVDFALAPYWFATALPNKIPQFLFLIGLVLLAGKLALRFSNQSVLSAPLVGIAILGSHFIGIQIGTAMLDIVIAYLFFACLDSFLEGNIILAGIEGTLYFWSKPFMPFQIVGICILLIIIRLVLSLFGFKESGLNFGDVINNQKKTQYLRNLKYFVGVSCVSSVVIAGPFIGKSLYYSGTPLYPFGAGSLMVNKNIDKDSHYWKSLSEAANKHISAKDAYGYGRTFAAFIRHFWLIAVPEKDVNNKYDYPVGLMYLIFLGPFLYFFWRSIKKRRFTILPFFLITYWLIWWSGSQQTRFLYIPVILMVILVSSEIKYPTLPFLVSTTIALMLTTLSVFGAHKKDLGKSTSNILRDKDRCLLQMNAEYLKSGRRDRVSLEYYDVAYACFPVMVAKTDSAWVLDTDN